MTRGEQLQMLGWMSRADKAERLLREALELLGDFADDPSAGDFRARAESHLRCTQGADCHNG